MMKRIAAAILALTLWVGSASAQAPIPNTGAAGGGGGSGTVTSVTCNAGLTGGTFTTNGTCGLDLAHVNVWTAEQTMPASASGGAGFNLPQGAAPTSPANGDVWTTSAGIFVRIAGSTVGPLGTGGGSSAFGSITGGTNTTAAMVVSTGASLAATGSGTIAATSLGSTVFGTLTNGDFCKYLASGGQVVCIVAPTGSGSVVLANSPSLTTPALDVPSFITLTNATGLPAASVLAGTLANPMLATTQSAADNSTKLATTAYADRAASNVAVTVTGSGGPITGVTTLTCGVGLVVTGSTPNATCTPAFPVETAQTSGFTFASTDMGKLIPANGSSIAATISATGFGTTIFAANQTACVENINASALTITNSSGATMYPTVASVPQNATLCLQSDGSILYTTLSLASPYAIANGGTGATTAASARTNLGVCASVSVVTFGDTSPIVASTTGFEYTTAALTTPRTITLPAGNAYPTNCVLQIYDKAGGVTSTNTLTVTAAGTDTINGAATQAIGSTYGTVNLQSDGGSPAKWTIASDELVQAVAQVAHQYLCGLSASGQWCQQILGAGDVPAAAMPALTGDITTSAGAVATTISASAVTTSKVNNAAITYAKVQNESASTLLGNPTGSPGAPSEITLGANLSFSGTTLVATAGGSGCTVSGGAGAVYNSGSSTCVTNTDQTFATGVLSLGINTSELGAVKMFGGTSGNLTIEPAAVAGTNSVLKFPGASFDFSGSGGSNQFVKQTSSGGAFSVAVIAAADLPAATTSTAGAVKLNNAPVAVGWVAGVNPNNATIAVINQASTITAIIGDVETATGGTATVSVFEAASGTACSAGTVLHSGSFNANGTAATNQTLTLTTTTIAAGSRLCLQTTGTTTWTGGTGIGAITVFLAPS